MAELTAHNSISEQAADKLIAAHDGDVALLYLYWLRHGEPEEEQAARDLCRTLQDIRAAEEKLRRMGLPEGEPSAPSPARAEPAPEETLPQYSKTEMTRLSRDNQALEVIYAEAAQVLGKVLGANDMRVLLGMYDYLSLPTEVILVLLHYCEEQARLKYGEGHRPTPRFLEREAYAWANREILTLEQAEAYIKAQRERRSELDRLRERLELPALSPTQQKDLSAWLDQGFGEEEIAIAADRTMTNTGALKWSYLRRILQSWHEHGLHTAQAIREKDPPRSQSRAVPPPRGEDKPVEHSDLEYIRKKIRG